MFKDCCSTELQPKPRYPIVQNYGQRKNDALSYIFTKPLPLTDELIDLQQKTGYLIVQEYGQRKTGPPPFWTGPPPPKGCEVFVGKIPRDIFEDQLFPLFQQAGVIYQFRLMMEFSRSNRGFAFVRYSTQQEAQNAIAFFDGYEIRKGHRIGVLKSVDNCKLYIGNIPMCKSREEIYSEITKYTRDVRDVIVYIGFSCADNKIKNSGFCFVEYETHFAASMARKCLIPDNVKLFDCENIVDWGPKDIDEADTKQDLILYVCNIPFHIEEIYLMHLFSLQFHLPVRKIRKIRDFAFVDYFSTGDAETALNKMNGVDLDGSVIKVTWAKQPGSLNLPERLDKLTLSDHAEYSMTLQNYKNPHWSNPVKVLSTICERNGWGKPVFYVIHSTSGTDEDNTTFKAKVFIPNFPCYVKHFIPSEVYFSIKEAKICAAEYTLRTISFLISHKNTHPTPEESFSPIALNFSSSSRICTALKNDFVPESSEYKNALPPPAESFNPMTLNFSSSSSSICTALKDEVVPESSEFLDQDHFYSVLASAASLANLQLQSEKNREPAFKLTN